MQYAQVAVDAKTSLDRQTFTYLIPPQLLSDIKPGILVLVPFHGRKILGVITAIKRFSNLTIKNKLKPIIKIVEINPVLDEVRLRLGQWLSEYYFSPLGEALFIIIPPIALRQVDKKNIEQYTSPKIAIAENEEVNRKKIARVYTLYDREENRNRYYLRLIKKAQEKNKHSMILFPSIQQAQKFQSKFDKDIKSILYHSEMTKTQRYLIWNDIGAGKYPVVIGTRPTVFAPINNLGLIIIDQPENFGYKEDQSPRYHSVAVAKKLSEITGANLILGSLAPSVESYYLEKIGKYKKLSRYKVQGTRYKIIDLSNQKNKIISWELEQAVKSTIANSGKVLLFTQRKGEGSSFICQDCGYAFKCSQCEIPYSQLTTYNLQLTALVCHRCNIKKPIPTSCPNCHGVKLKSYGIGTETVKREIDKLIPQVKIGIVDIDTTNNQFPITNYQIVIATKKILDYQDWKFDLVGIIGLDNLLNLPDYGIGENIYFTIVKLIYMAKNQFILQTYNPENDFWNFIKAGNVNIFLENELQDRKKYGFPPFGQLIKLVYQNESEEKCQEETEKIILQVTSYLSTSSRPLWGKLQVFGPNPAFIPKVRGKFQYQMIVFINSAKQKNQLREIIAKISKGWKIDVDPISLI